MSPHHYVYIIQTLSENMPRTHGLPVTPEGVPRLTAAESLPVKSESAAAKMMVAFMGVL